MEMKNALADIPATGSVAPGMTDLERRVASSEHASGGDMGDTGAGDVRVAERHGIWTVSAAGHFLGDYLDEKAALAAAAQARSHGAGGGTADPWQRAEVEVGV
jgi:hypothetical protein